MKKVLSIFLCITIVLSLCNVCATEFRGRAMNEASEWANADIRKLSLLLNTYQWECYDYQKEIDRQELCENIMFFSNYLISDCGFKEPEKIPQREDEVFQDTSSWYVNEAYSLGFVDGTEPGKFSPDRIVTREEAAVMFYRMMQAFEIDISALPAKAEFKPQNVSDWATDAVNALWNTEAFGRVLNIDEENPQIGITYEEIFSALWYLIEDVLGEQAILLYEETEPEILVELGIVAPEDWEKKGYITELEALAVIDKISADGDMADLSSWYGNDDLAEYDNLPDEHKLLLMSLANYGVNPIVKYSEFKELDFEGNITYSDAYLYVSRLLMDSSGCSPIPQSFLVRPKDDIIYEDLYQKGIIKSADTENCKDSIPRKEFYELLHRAIFCEFVVGGYIDIVTRYVDIINRRNKSAAIETQTTTNEIQLSNVVIHDDMSISWDFPEFIVTEESKKEDYMVDVDFLDDEGEHILGYGFFGRTELGGERVLLAMVKSYPRVPVKIRISYVDYLYTPQCTKAFEYWDEIDLSNIKVKEEGTAPTPGILQRKENQRPLKSITLADGDCFEEGAWYMLTSYEHRYRKEEYNSKRNEIFRATETNSTFVPDANKWVYADYPEDMHISKVKVEGTAEDGFIIIKTPESDGTFKVEFFK